MVLERSVYVILGESCFLLTPFFSRPSRRYKKKVIIALKTNLIIIKNTSLPHEEHK